MIKDYKNRRHLIFFHGIGDNYENAKNNIEELINGKFSAKNDNIIPHVHKYPAKFQKYISYFIASFLFLGASILVPIVTLLLSSSITFGLAASLICIFLSISLLAIPFIDRDKSLFESSIKEIEQLMKDGVNSNDIILLGHSFGGVPASEVLKHFSDNNIRLGGVIFNNTFNSFEKAIRNFPMPQAKILSILPEPILEKLLKSLSLDFCIEKDIYELLNKKELNTPMIMLNHPDDRLIPQPAQLNYAFKKEDTMSRHKGLIKTELDKYPIEYCDDPHNNVFDYNICLY